MEDFLGQEGPYLAAAAPEPFSPSIFLDLPPTPRGPHVAGGAEEEPDDLVLPFISRMLMEEDIDEKFFYQFPDHPALLNAQLPYAQILSADTSSSSPDPATTTTTTSSGSGTGGGGGGGSTLSFSSSSVSADPAPTTWPYDPVELSQLLRSPPYSDMAGVGLDDFTADEINAFLLPGQGEPDAGFQQSSPGFFSDAAAAGGGHQLLPGASISAHQSAAGVDGAQLQQLASSAAQNGVQSPEETKMEATALPAGEADHAALASAFFGGAQNGGNMDMLNMAFLKGMEEAKKFLPTNNSLLVDIEDNSRQSEARPADSKPTNTVFPAAQVKTEEAAMFGGSGNGRGRKNRHAEEDLEAETSRNSKLMMPEQEEAGASELFDELMSYDIGAFMKRLQDLRIAKDSESEKSTRKGSKKGARRGTQRTTEVVDLHTMLIHCAQAVAIGDRRSATEMLKQIKQHSSPRGDATERLAYCFAEGLEARLAGTGSQVYQSLVARSTSAVEFLRAYKLFMAASSFKKANIIFTNRTILNAVAGRSKLHIVVYGLQYGLQWPGLLYFLAGREGGPPEVRFTGIDHPQPGFRPAYQIEETGRRLSNCALEFGVPFKFQAIAAKWETVCAEHLNIDPDEVLVVNSECQFSTSADESSDVDIPSPRDMVLNNIREMRPDVFIQFIVNGTYGAPFFLTRFREALFFYSAYFDMLDTTIPRDNDERLLIERDILGRCALNVIACEGADRVDRPETYKQWQVRNLRAGLKQLPLKPEVVKLVRDKVKNYYHKDFLIDEDNCWLLQGWKGRVLYATSTWVARDNNSTF